jgi:hypothetical protein
MTDVNRVMTIDDEDEIVRDRIAGAGKVLD